LNLTKEILVITEQVTLEQAKILKELIADGRQNNCAIAKKTGLPKEVVKKNIEKLEKNGVITGATIHINYKSFGYKAVAHILISVDSQQIDQLTEYLQKKPEVYYFYSRGVKGNIDIVATLKKLEQLNDIKDNIKRHFSLLEMRTAIWTDVKEMNDNLSISSDIGKNVLRTIDYMRKPLKKSNPKTMNIDEIDQKIADRLSENGRMSMETLGKEIGISTDTARRRYEKLKKNGVLKVTIQVNPVKIGYKALCIFFTETSNENSFVIIEKISNIPDVISIMKTTGDYDLQIYAMVKDIDQLLFIQDEIGKISGIIRIDMEVIAFREEKWPSPRQYISTF